MCDHWNTGLSIGTDMKMKTFSIVNVQSCIPYKICIFDADDSIVFTTIMWSNKNQWENSSSIRWNIFLLP